MSRLERVLFTFFMLSVTFLTLLWGFKGLYSYLLSHPAVGIAFAIFIALINFGIYHFVFLSGRPQKPKIKKRLGYKYCESCTQEMGLMAAFCCYCGKKLLNSKESPTAEHINAENEFANTVGGHCSEGYHQAILKHLRDEQLLYPRCFCALCGTRLL